MYVCLLCPISLNCQVKVNKFIRWGLGDGIERVTANLAADVQKALAEGEAARAKA